MKSVFFALLLTAVAVPMIALAEEIPPKKADPPPPVAAGVDLEDIIPDPIFVDAIQNPPRLLNKVEPVWPDSARDAGMPGRVSVQYYIDEKGVVQKAFVLKAKPKGWGFEDAAMNAIMQYRYAPPRIDGKPSGLWMVQTIDFEVKR